MDYGRLGFLTRIYGDQGLRSVPVGALLAGWGLIDPVWPESSLRVTVDLLLIIAVIAGSILIGRYYENRFGRVQPSRVSRLSSVLVVTAYWAARWLDTRGLPVSVASMVVGWWFAEDSFGSSGRRWYFLVPFAAFVVLGLLPLTEVVSVEAVDGRIFLIAFGCALIFTGVFDHLLLVRSLPVSADA